MTGHVRVSDHSGAGGRCGAGYHMRALGICSCGWTAEVAWAGNTCGCTAVHTADGLAAADTLATRLVNKHIRGAAAQSAGQQELL